ncbi:amidohydrolase family protein [Pandoraea pnomenusa]|uniref:amidohydrolase family protein n=1 Tax=Pandoraea pnomenusa TaxID=93220 RepID=UPI00043764C5|nr:amidohydrolase family protein [Pandoraea pnomenusa]AHN76536.1 cytosine deaminase [Pandoraea pnomenusa]ANC44075.1 cytosine deaminase [Pandoraea pnomenusa]MBN9095865.1 amidohydrolase family protein [Pandoraea pnomenusa]
MTILDIRNARALDGTPVDVRVEDGRIAAIGASLPPVSPPSAPSASPLAADGVTRIDARGALLLPGLVESHTHLDKTVWGMPWYVNDCGSRLIDRIDNERRWRAESGHDAGAASLALGRAFLAAGTTRLRTHVDIDTDAGLRHLEGVLATRETLADTLDMQIVAFPQSGVLDREGTVALLDAALARGADVLGWLDPCAIDRDPKASLDAMFALADKHGCPIDMHLHEPGEMGVFTFELMLERIAALGMQGRVVVSHAFCLGELDMARADAMLARLADAGVALITTAPPSRVVPPLMACRRAGVPLAGGNDGIRDTWTPYGVPDMLERAMMIGLRYNLRRDDELEMALDCVTHQGARTCWFDDYGLHVGARADLVLVDAVNAAQAIVTRAPRRWVVANGRVVVSEGVAV